ncbi:MAG: carbohydrate ABC transporter permease [Chloroflexi bacterium]|nr:carbohydrate ABC transporter permease [Chloroflexota bacterium]
MFSNPKVLKFMRKAGYQVLVYLLLIPLAVIFSTPLLWLVSTALKPDTQMSAWPPVWIPRPPQWGNFTLVFTDANFGLYLKNTLIIAVLSTIGSVVTSSMTAFGFSRLRFPGRDILFSVLLATMMLPYVVTLVPTFILFRRLGWLNSYRPLIVPSFFGGGAFFIFLLRQSFSAVPHELFEQARIDGASSYRQYWQIMLPLSKPVLSTVTIFSLMNHWNDFMGPLIYINDPQKFTLSLGLRSFMGMSGAGVRYQEQMAFALLMTLPLLVAFFSFQQYFIKGVIMTGIKG